MAGCESARARSAELGGRRVNEPFEVHCSKKFWHRVILLFVLLTPFSLMALSVLGKGSAGQVAILATVALVLLMIPGVLVLSRRRWVQRFDRTGVTLRNGRAFSWGSFEKVVAVSRRYQVTHYDLVFREGKAMVAHQMAENRAEVESLMNRLGRGDNPFLQSTA